MEFTHLGVKHEFVAYFVHATDAIQVGSDLVKWFVSNHFTDMEVAEASAGGTVVWLKQPARAEILTVVGLEQPMVSIDISVGPDNKWSPKELDNFAMQFKLTWC